MLITANAQMLWVVAAYKHVCVCMHLQVHSRTSLWGERHWGVDDDTGAIHWDAGAECQWRSAKSASRFCHGWITGLTMLYLVCSCVDLYALCTYFMYVCGYVCIYAWAHENQLPVLSDFAMYVCMYLCIYACICVCITCMYMHRGITCMNMFVTNTNTITMRVFCVCFTHALIHFVLHLIHFVLHLIHFVLHLIHFVLQLDKGWPQSMHVCMYVFVHVCYAVCPVIAVYIL